MIDTPTDALDAAQIDAFITHGFVRLDRAFAPSLADQARAILWRDMGLDPDDPAGWTQPVVRLGHYSDPPFVAAANTPLLRAAYDQLAGRKRWLPPGAVGTFPVRFPSTEAVDDDGWHIDVSFGTDAPDFMDWRANIVSRGRMLLMLFLFSEVGAEDAPTRIRAGSHRAIARALAPAGEAGLTLRALLPHIAATEGLPEVTATGPAGTVYLCHPFLVHAAQAHRGARPRFLAQPPLLPRAPLRLDRPASEASPVERAIQVALAGAAGG